MTIRADQFQFVCDLLKRKTGNELGADKSYLVETRLSRLTASGQSLVDYLDEVKAAAAHPDTDRIIESMLIGETYFFRDPAIFDWLADSYLPEIIAKREASRQLRIWCGAVSTGQEIYSLAMLLLDRFPEVTANWNIELLGTDISQDSLQRCKDGIYSSVETDRGLTGTHQRTWFDRTPHGLRLRPAVQDLVTLRLWNLLDGAPDLEWDLVLVRNVLIYFREEDRERILTRITHSLADDGCVVTGATERHSVSSAGLIPAPSGPHCAYQRI